MASVRDERLVVFGDAGAAVAAQTEPGLFLDVRQTN